MVWKRLLVLFTLGLLTFLFTHNVEANFGPQAIYTVERYSLPAYSTPNIQKEPLFYLYKGMDIHPTDVRLRNGYKWFKISKNNYWIPAIDPNGEKNVVINPNPEAHQIIDMYGILNLPHEYALKLVKYSDSEGRLAEGRLETYKKIDEKYVWQHSYDVQYPKTGPKSLYGDLKTVGGPVVRYVYRTTRSGMNGYNAAREHFGVYKVSYPMPHDGLPYLESGRMSVGQYNNLPTINYARNNQLYPHPHSMLGADIVIHTARKGSLGCIILENEEMSEMYHNDVVTKNNREVVPFIIYDEGVEAPVEGELF